MKHLDINFPLDKFEKLIIDIGWESLDDWFEFWNNKKNILSIGQFWNNKVNDDWIWGLALPLLSQAYKFKNNFYDRKIIGISALPGTGKTTLGKWLEAISLKLNFKIAVISIDDFYLPSEEMKLALLLNVIDPRIGGVMIMGDRGTGKSTTIRALADLLPAIDVVKDDPYNSSLVDPDLQSKEVLEKLTQGENLESIQKQVPMVDLPLGATEDRL